MTADAAGSRSRPRRLLILLAAAGVLAAGGYLGYQMVFGKNPEVVEEIRQAEETQSQLDDIFDSPGDEAEASGGSGD